MVGIDYKNEGKWEDMICGPNCDGINCKNPRLCPNGREAMSSGLYPTSESESLLGRELYDSNSKGLEYGLGLGNSDISSKLESLFSNSIYVNNLETNESGGEYGRFNGEYSGSGSGLFGYSGMNSYDSIGEGYSLIGSSEGSDFGYLSSNDSYSGESSSGE